MEDYIKRVIESNLKLGYSFEEIAADVKAATQRHLQREMKAINALEEHVTSTAGLNSLKRYIDKEG